MEDHDLFPEDQDQLGDLDLKKVIRSLKVILIFDLGKIALNLEFGDHYKPGPNKHKFSVKGKFGRIFLVWN